MKVATQGSFTKEKGHRCYRGVEWMEHPRGEMS